MTSWFTADTHFGHANIVTLGGGRPFATIDEHDETLIERWNARVRPGDDVQHLGDFSMSVGAMERVMPRLNGHISLVAGNHDRCWTSHPGRGRAEKAVRATPRYAAAGFVDVSVTGHGYMTVGGIDVMVSHLPATGDHTASDRYATQRPRPGVLPLVCGHVHELWRTSGRQVNVGVDQWDFAPVSEEQLVEVLRALPAF